VYGYIFPLSYSEPSVPLKDRPSTNLTSLFPYEKIGILNFEKYVFKSIGTTVFHVEIEYVDTQFYTLSKSFSTKLIDFILDFFCLIHGL